MGDENKKKDTTLLKKTVFSRQPKKEKPIDVTKMTGQPSTNTNQGSQGNP